MSRPLRARRRAAGLVASLAVGTGLLVGCGGGGGGNNAADGGAPCRDVETPEFDANTIRIAGDAWSGYAPFRDDTLLSRTGYDTVWVDQPCQEFRARDLSEGRIDVAVTTLDQFLRQRPDGVVVGVIDQSQGADALALGSVARPDLDTVDDIRPLVDEFAERGDKPVLAYTGDSPSEMLLNELANSTDELRLADFELVSVDQSSTAFQMLQDDRAQLAVLWEPDTSAAVEAGYEIVLSSADVPDSIVDVIVVGDRLIEERPAAVQAVVSSYYRRMDALLTDPAAMSRFYAEDGSLELATAQNLMEGIEVYGSAGANEYMNVDVFPLDRPLVEQSVNAIGSVLALRDPDVAFDQAPVDGSYVATYAEQIDEFTRFQEGTAR
jgi:ABC-type nitrate/sulfonate/bicarbonate transport system substrate-binding protein